MILNLFNPQSFLNYNVFPCTFKIYIVHINNYLLKNNCENIDHGFIKLYLFEKASLWL